MNSPSPRVAVAIPCLNEAVTIGKVVDDFRAQLPDARIVVLDNASTDESATIARDHGAEVLPVPRRGKGYVMARMLEAVDADILVMVDGDDTYPADAIGRLLAPVIAGEADMVIGTRLHSTDEGAFRPLHMAGNHLVRGLINGIFGCRLKDILSGYRAFTGDLAKNVPITSIGFEVETEFTVQTLYQGYSIAETEVAYRSRPAGSESKLHTFRDGFRVVKTIFSIFRSFRPMVFFGLFSALMAVLSVLGALPAIVQYLDTGVVRSWPLLGVAVGCGVISFTAFAIGIVLQAVNARVRELTAMLRKVGQGGWPNGPR